jgi:hypothetical protein
MDEKGTVPRFADGFRTGSKNFCAATPAFDAGFRLLLIEGPHRPIQDIEFRNPDAYNRLFLGRIRFPHLMGNSIRHELDHVSAGRALSGRQSVGAVAMSRHCIRLLK